MAASLPASATVLRIECLPATGSGLSLSHDLIAQGHGGALRVQYTLGQSTEFLITLAL